MGRLSIAASSSRYPRTTPPPAAPSTKNDINCRERYQHRRCGERNGDNDLAWPRLGLGPLTNEKMLLPERGELPLSPRFEGVYPSANENLGKRSTKSTWPITTRHHQRRRTATSYSHPPSSSSTNLVSQGDASMKAMTPQHRRRINQYFGFSPETG
jgi:hypothetical protein